MAKSMYQKREERKQKKLNSGENSGVNKIDINWFPGHMAKTKREIKEKISLIDIVYEVIDARCPISSKIIDIDDMIGNKKRILIMTKYDLCDREKTDKYIKMYEDKGYIVMPADLMSKFDPSLLVDASKKLLEGDNKKRESKGLKPRPIRALVIGIPNAGKSTLINRLVGKKSAGVANRPGHTKNLSWIRINKDVELMDSPGILWPKFDNQENAHILASLSAIKEEILNIDELAVFVLKKMYELYPKNLENRYGITELDEDMIEVYDIIAKKRGALSRGGVADYEKVSRLILRDLQSGALGNVTLD